MAAKSPKAEKRSGVSIGDVFGGIHHSIIAGRDVIINNVTHVLGDVTNEQQRQRNRRIMLERVRNFWIEGVLEKSLHKEILIQIGKQEAPSAIQHPWSIQVQESTVYEARRIPEEKPILDIFNDFGHSLLILGEPGSGKTITLLELCRDVIARSEKDSSQLIPVVFNLSSWGERQQSFFEWMLEELSLKYQIPKAVGREWLKENKLLLLLDGLDEVKKENRTACVEAINQFQQEYGSSDMVVCSRIEEYNTLAAKLHMQGAIILQGLSLEQIGAHLANLGDALTVLRTAIKSDATLQELARSPLILSIMIAAYNDMPADILHASETLEQRRERLFDLYVERMLARRKKNERYTPKQTIAWLSWLAHRMCTKTQMGLVFIEELQPAWLTGWRRICYEIGVRLAVITVFCAITSLVPFISLVRNYLVTGSLEVGSGNLPATLLAWGIFGFSAGLVSLLCVAIPRWLSIGLSLGLIVSIAHLLPLGAEGGLVYGLLIGLPGGISGAAVSSRNRITIVEAITLSWKRLIRAMGIGMIVGGITFLVMWYMSGSLTISLTTGLPVWWLVLFLSGITRCDISDKRVIPNQGIHRSGENAVVLGGGAIFVCMVSGGLIGIASGNMAKGVLAGLLFGVLTGIAVSMFWGGGACIQHLMLRLMLAYAGHLPWKLADFLEYATTSIMLRHVGGGYIFLHRSLLEYFATKEGVKREKSVMSY